MQGIILHGLETLVFLESMSKSIGETHTDFLQMITGRKAKQLGDGTWETLGAEGILESAGTQSDRIYIEQRQATMMQ